MNWKITPKAQPMRSSTPRERNVVLKVDKLVKKYGSRTVVQGVSFEVREGEIVGLLGANGAGKTTSFRMACGLIPNNGGTVMLNGLDVTNWPMYRRAREGRLGYLPQDRSTFGTLTTEENLYAAAEYLGLSRSEQKRRCEAALQRFNLLHLRKMKVGMGGTGGLSGGERRRLEIARALLAEPKILLLDEPFANVDPITVEEMQKVIRELAETGVAVLITDHQVDETLAITDRSYIISHGKVLCSGTPIEVLSSDAAIETYFGGKAQFSLERFAKKLGGSVTGAAPANTEQTHAAAERLGSSRESAYDEESDTDRPQRPTLSLTRRKTEQPKRTRSPVDDEPEPNRFEGKMKNLFKR